MTLSSEPVVLGFDTSAAHCAAALLSGDKIWAERHVALGRGQAEALLPLIEEMMADEGVSWPDIGLIGVGIGPGNFTGTRISVSAARGLALALGIPALGVTAFETMRGRNSLADKRRALVSLAAPRGTFYLQEFAEGAAVGAPQQVSVWTDEITLTNRAVEEVVGHDAVEIAHYINQTGLTEQPVRHFRAEPHQIGATIAAIALGKWQAGQTNPERPAPIYVRPADAAPSRDSGPVMLP